MLPCHVSPLPIIYFDLASGDLDIYDRLAFYGLTPSTGLNFIILNVPEVSPPQKRGQTRILLQRGRFFYHLCFCTKVKLFAVERSNCTKS
nr:MAG: hypothetical protein [Chiromantes dehaani nimavirus]